MLHNICDLHYTIRKNKCAQCRYKKCLAVGMRKEYFYMNDNVHLPNAVEVPNLTGNQRNFDFQLAPLAPPQSK